ncbi:hypothetical protein V8C26DRAFT_175713 [Trichoderma gracile]
MEPAASVQPGHVTRYLASTTLSTFARHLFMLLLVHRLYPTRITPMDPILCLQLERTAAPFHRHCRESQTHESLKLQLISQPTRGCSMSTLRAIFRLLHPVRRPSICRHSRFIAGQSPPNTARQPSEKGNLWGAAACTLQGVKRALSSDMLLHSLSLSPSLCRGGLCSDITGSHFDSLPLSAAKSNPIQSSPSKLGFQPSALHPRKRWISRARGLEPRPALRLPPSETPSRGPSSPSSPSDNADAETPRFQRPNRGAPTATAAMIRRSPPGSCCTSAAIQSNCVSLALFSLLLSRLGMSR